MGAITGYFDVAQVALYVFWIFFAGLIYYLLQENKREGYPLESDRSAHVMVQGWPPMPSPKTFRLQHGGTVTVPDYKRLSQTVAADPSGRYPGAPLNPTGNPMLDGVGPGAYAQRSDEVELTFEGDIKIVPLRAALEFDVAAGDTDPRGLPVLGADGKTAGTVREVWVDRSEAIFRYLEVTVPVLEGHRYVLLPINFTRIGEREIKVASILSHQFAQVPATRHPDQVTRLEEERVMAYYGGGTLYAEPSRLEPLL